MIKNNIQSITIILFLLIFNITILKDNLLAVIISSLTIVIISANLLAQCFNIESNK
ncbi:hypothetical protein G6Z38_09115 [Clostridium perfringens]|nr:hypothetical protein [Clostridium perfringens]